jgi:RNA polymerase sigma factor (sigma-70 family)
MQSSKKDKSSEIVEHLFRREAGRITSVLTRIFGIENIELAEDVVQDTILKALQQWPYSGIPDNPSAWLFRSAKNKAIDILRRNRLNNKYSEEISALFESEWKLGAKIDEFFSENEIIDDQLRMIFTCCHPKLPTESQIALALKNLCGFSIKEVAKAFLTNEATIIKRLSRAKDKIRSGTIKFEIPVGIKLERRIKNVLSTLYLLFNEGYNSSKQDILIREDLIKESIHLAELLIEHPLTENDYRSEIYALLALMYLHYARTPARIDDSGNILLLKDQDRNLWDRKLIAKGMEYLEKSASGDKLSGYHLQAGISYFYATAENFEKIEWGKILNLYNILYKMNGSAIIGLNRAIVISQLLGAETAIDEIKKLAHKSSGERLENYYLYHSTLGELYFQTGNYSEAKTWFEKAIQMTSSEIEKKLLHGKLGKIIRAESNL